MFRNSLRDYGIVLLACLVGCELFVFSGANLETLRSATFGDGSDEVSFLFIFHRMGTNLLTLSWPLFDGKMMFPSTNSLLFSESMILSSVVYRALLTFVPNPILTFNLTLVFLLCANGLMMYWCARHWFGRGISTVLAVVFTFSVIRTAHLMHSHCFPQFCFPWVAGLLCRYERSGNRRYLNWAAFVTALQFYFSVTLGTLLLVTVIPYFIFKVAQSARITQGLKLFAVPLLIFSVLAGPLGVAYFSVSHQNSFKRNLSEVKNSSITPRNFFTVPREHPYASRLDAVFGSEENHRQEKCFFLGWAAMLLIGLGLRSGWKIFKKRSPSFFTLFLITYGYVVWLSLGVNGGLYQLMYYAVPILRGVRTPGRFGLVLLFLSCFLIGLGLQAILQSQLSRAKKVALLSFFAVLFYFDTRFTTPHFEIERRLSGVTDVLRDLPNRDPLVHLPVVVSDREEGIRLFYSLDHNHPLVNGRAGFHPSSYQEVEVAGIQLLAGQSDPFFRWLDQHGLRYLLVEKKFFTPTRLSIVIEEIDRRGFHSLYADESVLLYSR